MLSPAGPACDDLAIPGIKLTKKINEEETGAGLWVLPSSVPRLNCIAQVTDTWVYFDR